MVWIWKVFGPSDSFHGSLFFASTSQSSLLFLSLNLEQHLLDNIYLLFSHSSVLEEYFILQVLLES